MKCPSCGEDSRIRKNDKYCHTCGTALSAEECESEENNSLYEDMVEALATFVIRTANKDNPTPSEVNAMVEVGKMLFRTI